MAKFYLSLLLLCTAPVLLAQPNEQPVRFANGNFFTGDNIRRNSFRQTALQPTLYNGRYYVLVKFAQLPDEAQQQALQQAGVQLLQYLPGRAYLATIQQRFDFAAAARYGIASINVLPPMYKLDDRIVRYTAIADKTAQPLMAIALLDEAARQPALEALAQLGAAVVPQPLHGPQVIYIRPDTAVAQAMAALPYVGYIHLQATGHHTLNHNSVGAQAISALHNGKNLLGKGVAIGVGDDAEVSSHIDFTGRLINRSFGFANNHGTHVTGTAAGGGLFNPLYRGMAPRATIVSQIYNGIILNAPSYVADHDMVLTNNSYHTGELNCPGNSVYDLNSRLVDAQTLGYGQLLHVVASGNDGAYTCAGYPAAYATIKSGWQCAKNVLTVGAAKIDDYTIAPFSSRGPVKDGRLKPELVANGWAVSSTFPNNNYAWFFGTSMAAPQVTGGLSLLYERYRQLNGGANPSGALVKAVACNSAEDLGNPGPDFTFGFGLLNARRALEALEQNRYFSGSLTNGANAVHTISVPAGARRLKVLLYWMDREALPNAAVTLINDLDLTVSGPGGTVLPLVLNTLPSGVGLPAAPGADHLNNIEQVVIENPGNGDYHININGFAIPQGPQNYVVTYEITNPGVTVEYPYGGETWVPGAVENIRWNAYGNEGNTFTVEYSANNGASWTVLSNAVPATARSYNWATGPATPTDSALIRVTRNGTGLVGQSSRPFVVLGQPVVTAATVCDGAVQLTWPAVTNATGYDIMRMSGDTMRVIGSTSGLSYVVKGLTASNIPNWLAVRAKTANAVGRRSVVASAPVCCGPCTLADFDNDVKAEVILEPTSGREHTQRAFDPEKPVKVRFKNLDDAPISGPMTVAYMVNGAGPYTEIISPTVAAGASFEHTLTRQHPLPLGGPFELAIKAWITRPGDTNPANDTAYAVVKKLDNQLVLGFPVAEGFESTATAEYNAGTMGLQGNDRFDFATNTVRGRLRTFVNTGMARSGSKALTMDQAPFNSAYTSDSLTGTYNLQLYDLTAVQLRYDFYYKNHSQKSRPGNKVWMRGSETSPWIEAYDLYANQSPNGQWKFASININDVLGNAVPPQGLSSSFQIRFGQEGQASATNVVATNNYEDGYTFDDLWLTDAVNDIALLNIVTPAKKDCELGNSTPVAITVKNYSGSAQNNIPVSYRLNGGTVVTEVIPTLNPNQTLTYTFTAQANTSVLGQYNFEFWTGHAPDTYRSNDSILNYSFFKSPLINSFPYYEGFESNNGNWYTNGFNSSWEWGAPDKTTIAKAANGNKAWVTSLTERYKDNEYSNLVSPCFDISGMAQPVLSFSHIFEIEDDCDCDYTWVEYSIDGGENWQRLGLPGNGTNWYDNSTAVAWQVSQKKWHVASYDLPPGNYKIKFRFVMFGDAGVNFEGVGIDDVHLFDKAAIYAGPVSIGGTVQTVNGNDWVHFNDATGKRIASIHPQGQNLGSTTVQVHPYTGQVRFANQQYYANRNIVVQPTAQPLAPVRVRFYFTDTEAKALLAATGCGGCTPLNDPYELGVTQYTGPATEENGTLSDNTAGTYRFLLPDTVAIIPYDNGYFAEYNVDAFSEFWLGKGSIAPPAANSCTGDTLVYTAASSGSSYQWQVDNGSGFTTLTNNGNYSGATAPALRIVGLPTSSSGWRYRCVVDGVPGNAVTLRFTRIWNGSSSNDWANTANWGCGALPDAFTDVLIPGGLDNYPLVTVNAAIRQLRVSPGATVNVAAGVVLEVKGR